MITDSQREFILEAREHLLQIEQSLLSLETTGEAQLLRSQIDRSLRALHSLKGDAGFLGFSVLRQLAHAMESLLERYRDASSPLPLSVLEILFAARDRLAELTDQPDLGQTTEIADIVARLAQAEQTSETFTPRNLNLNLSTLSAAPNGLLRGFFGELSVLGQLVGPVIVTNDAPESLADHLPHAPVWLRATLVPGVPDKSVNRLLGTGSESTESFAPTLPASSNQTTRTELPAVPLNTYPIELNLGTLNSGTTAGLAASLQRLAAAGTLAQPALQFGPCDLAEACPIGPVLLTGLYSTSLPWDQFHRTFQPSSSEREPELQKTDLSADSPSGTTETPTVRAEVLSKSARITEPRRSTPEGTAEADRLSSLRVNVELLDRMMTLVGELTLLRNQSIVAFAEEEGSQRTIIQRLSAVTTELQDTVLRTRMQPVGNLFGRFSRMVRDLARQLTKQIDLVTIGREVELDKTVLEQLSDPLMHLIRNSVDHGIEHPDERLAKGKPRTGTITLTATPVDGQVVIEIRDDGRGIDPVAVRNKAATLRLRPPAELERMTPRELFSLILLPGFSTAKQVTDVSGRGVGMDVVKTNIEQLEGSLTIDSVPGVGTSMLLRVPLTLAIIPCLIVDVASERFAVPQRELEEIVCLYPGGKGMIEQSLEGEVFRLRESLLPVVRMCDVLEQRTPFTADILTDMMRKGSLETKSPDKIEYIVVLRSRGRRFGLVVDEVRDTQDIVVKPMHPTMRKVRIFSGATLMGDGRVTLIASVDGIAEHANCFRYSPPEQARRTAQRNPQEVHRVLIFEAGPSEQFALPLVQIRRLELIQSEQIECVGNTEFVMLQGVATRVVRLDQVVSVSACPNQSELYLILPKFIPEPMGILVSRIVDTDTLAIELQEARLPDAGVLGTANVRGRLSLFLDVQYIREQVFGRVECHPVNKTTLDPARQPHVLLIDDTPFFREVVRRYLEQDNLRVSTAVDGVDGLQKLSADQFDLVVSDIEMPNLDGWGFAQAARLRGCQIPILALTSLSKAEYGERALAGGFNDFEEKLDHDSLLQAIHRLLNLSDCVHPPAGSPTSAGGVN